MKTMQTRFERDPALDHIEIVVRAPEIDSDVTKLIEDLSRRNDALLAVDTSGAWIEVPVSKIISVSVRGRQVSIITESGNYVSRQSLQSIEDTLKTHRFVRISRFEIVNLAKVRRYDFTLSGTLRIELAGGMETWASRRCIPLIRKRLQEKE